MDCIPQRYEIDTERGRNQFKRFFSIEAWADISLGLRDEETDPEDYRCEEALECIPLAYEIRDNVGVGQYKWFFSKTYWEDEIRGKLNREEILPDEIRCGEPANCIPTSYEIDDRSGEWQYRRFFSEEEWNEVKDGLSNGDTDPEELRCGNGALECIPINYTVNTDKGNN